jgi:hypothetical protein
MNTIKLSERLVIQAELTDNGDHQFLFSGDPMCRHYFWEHFTGRDDWFLCDKHLVIALLLVAAIAESEGK